MQMSVVEPPSTEDPCHETCHEPEVKPFVSSNQTPDCEPTVVDSTEQSAEQVAEETIEMLGKLPSEIGMLLVMSGIAGILLPGPVGTPLLIAGGVTMWPKTFQPIERWFSRRFPKAHREGVYQIKQFVENLQNRFPDKKPGAKE